MRTVKLDSIRIDGGTQSRVVIDQPTVYNYKERMVEGDIFPPMFAVFDGTTYWLVDGFHRWHALKLLGIKELEIEYKPGTLEEAQVMAFGVNGTHGKPRTNEDKRKAVQDALVHPLTKDKSDNEIAKICKVSRSFVGAVRNPEVKEQQKRNKNNSKNNNVEAACSPTTSLQSEGSLPDDGANPDEHELRMMEKAHEADIEAMHKLLAADDKLAEAHAEIQRLNKLVADYEMRMAGLIKERNEAIKMVKQYQKQMEKKDKK